MARTPLLTAAALLLAFAASPAATQAVEIDEWTVPWEKTRPRDPDIGPDGRVWFVGQRGDYLASLEPAGGDFQRFDLSKGSGPHNLIVGDDGTIWYAGNRAAHIGRLDPASGDIEMFPMPDPKAEDPHTLVFDTAGRIWFTVQGGNFVGRLSPGTKEYAMLEVPTPEARPYGIVVDASDRPWFTEFGSNKLGTVDPAELTLEEIELPREAARPRRLAVTSDQKVWYVDYAEGYLGRYDPESGGVEEWRVPGGPGAKPYGMAADDRDRLWFVETGPEPNRFVGFDPAAESFFSITPIPSGGGAVRHMVFDPKTSSIWFGTDANTIGRARLP